MTDGSFNESTFYLSRINGQFYSAITFLLDHTRSEEFLLSRLQGISAIKLVVSHKWLKNGPMNRGGTILSHL